MNPAERVTAVTDLLLSALVIAGIVWLARQTMPSGARRLWFSGLIAFAAAGVLGFVVHWFPLEPATRKLIWQPLFLTLGSALALMMAGAVADWRGYPAGRRALPLFLLVALGFYLATRASGGKFIVFVAFQALAVLFLLLVYGRLWMAERRRGSGWMFAGFVLTLIAGVAQAMKHIELHAIWTFDHNGIYHLIQMPGVVCLCAGLRWMLGPEPDPSS